MLGVSFLVLVVVNSVTTVSVSVADTYSRSDFPPGFVFGVGTSAYQVEGAANEDGRTPTICDTFAHSGITQGANGDVACDQYHKYKEDVQLMKEFGMEAYRFSISWSRLIAKGRGSINPRGAQYYNNLINELIGKGIQPHVTLHHFDTPQALEDAYGGFLSQEIVNDFMAYADACFKLFGDRVKYWTTFNEPNLFAIFGYDFGLVPPQRCSWPFGFGFNCSRGNSSTEPYIVAHNILLAHASATQLYKEKYQHQQKGYIGLNLLTFWFYPSTNSSQDIAATQRANEFYVGWFADPLVFGDYPDVVKKNAGSRIPSFTPLESKKLRGSFDFLGLNYYFAVPVKDNTKSLNNDVRDLNADMAAELAFVFGNNSSPEYPVSPWGLQGVLEYFKQVYGNPQVYIHENGQRMQRNKTLLDQPRVDALQEYIGSLLDSVRNGSNTRGYFVWSLLDVFEIIGGYELGFGLFYVDLDDPELKRYPKLSAHWYSHFLRGGRVGSDSIIELVNNYPLLSSNYMLK